MEYFNNINEYNKQSIKKQYHKLVLKHHPDKGGDNEIFQNITMAYEILKNDD